MYDPRKTSEETAESTGIFHLWGKGYKAGAVYY